MGWSVSELDKNKTEQSISNEEARLDSCREILEKLVQEREIYKERVELKLSEYDEKIEKLTNSIVSGFKFVEECKNHLKSFENEV